MEVGRPDRKQLRHPGERWWWFSHRCASQGDGKGLDSSYALKLSQQDFLMDWICGMREKEEPNVTTYCLNWAPGRVQVPLAEMKGAFTAPHTTSRWCSENLGWGDYLKRTVLCISILPMSLFTYLFLSRIGKHSSICSETREEGFILRVPDHSFLLTLSFYSVQEN